MNKKVIITKPTGNWLFGFRADGADRSSSKTRTVDGDGLPFEEFKEYTLYQWRPDDPVSQVFNQRTFTFRSTDNGSCCKSMPCTSLEGYYTSLGWYTKNMPIASSPEDYTHHVVGKIQNGVFMPMALPKELLQGSTGGGQLPIPPSIGVPPLTFTVGVPFSYTLLPWTGASEYEVKDLPAGFSFNASTRVISGTGTTSGQYNVVVVGISPAGLRNSITTSMTGQEAPVSTYFDEVSFTRDGSSLVWTFKGEAGLEGAKIKMGLQGSGFDNAAYVDLVKVAEKTYQYTYLNVSDGDYFARVQVGEGFRQGGFVLDQPGQKGRIYPGQTNLLTEAGTTIVASSGSGLVSINDLVLDNEFSMPSSAQPVIRANFTRARVKMAYIYTNYPADFANAWVIVGDNLAAAGGDLQTNLNRSGVKKVQIGANLTSPIAIDLGDHFGSSAVLQAPDTRALRLSEWQLVGDRPAENHPPVIATIPDIVRTEGQSLDYVLKNFVSDVDGDAFTLKLTMAGGTGLPAWLTFDGTSLKATALPWEGGSLVTLYEYNLVLTATDEHGSSTSLGLKLKIQRVGTLSSLISSSAQYDFLSSEKRLVIGATVKDAGPMLVDLQGNGFVYGGSGKKVMPNGTRDDFPAGTNKLLNAKSPEGFSNVQPGEYTVIYQEFEGGPEIRRALTVPAENMGPKEIYKAADTGTPTTPTNPNNPTPTPQPAIVSISHTIDSNGKPVVNTVTQNVTTSVEVALVQINGGGWNQTGFGAAAGVNGSKTNYQRAYTQAAPAGSYRYDVKITGTDIVQSGTFTIGATATDYFMQIDWSNGGVGYLNIRAQVVTQTGVELKWANEENWRTLNYFENASKPLPGAKVYVLGDYIPVATSERTLQFRKTGTTQVINVTVPAGTATDDGQWHSIWSQASLLQRLGYTYDPNNDSMYLYVEPKAGKTLQVLLEADNLHLIPSENGVNYGEILPNRDSGIWKTGVWYDLIGDSSQVGYSFRRRFERGSGSGVAEVAHKLKVREKNTESPVQTIIFTPESSQDSVKVLPIAGSTEQDGGTTTPTPVVGTKIMVLGDSITTDSRWRIALSQGLTAAGQAVTFVGSQGAGNAADPRHEGHPGYKISQITDGVAGWINAANPDMILLMIGTNNVNDGGYNMANVAQDLGALLDKIYATKSNVKLLVSNVPPRDEFFAQQRVNTLNEQIPAVVASRKAHGRYLEYVGAASSLTTADLSDKTHLNDSGNAKLGAAWSQGIQVLSAGTPTTSPNASARLAPVRDVYAVYHYVSYEGEMTERKQQLSIGFDEGLLTGVKLTLTYATWKNPASRAAFINLYTWITVVKRKKCAIHFDMKFEKNHPMPASVGESTSELYTNGNSTEQYYFTPSFSQNDGFTAWRLNGDTTNWNPNTPKRILYDELVVPAIQVLEAIAPIWFLAQGRTHTGEGGYNSRVDSLSDAKFGGNEDSEKAAFKAWLYVLGGGTIQGVRNLLGNQSLTDADLTFLVPSRGSWDAFWSTLKGGGLRQAWFEFRSRRVEQDQKMFEWYCRSTNPNIPVAFEAGTFAGNQANINGTTETLTIASTADIVKENPTWSDNWGLKADVGRGLKIRFTGDADGSLWDDILQLWRRGYGIPGSLSHNDIAMMMLQLLQGNGYVGVFGDINLFYPALRILKARGIIGSDFVTIYNTSTITYSSEEYRDPYSYKNLNAWKAPGTNCVQVNSPWPLAA
ncbi:putative Ig domain-containing protein [Larkinella insperata]|uniref:Ig domain-containing protein n=1 Tax=Larkinella insperata TaxID=332158 RepID=A0ABW3QFL3_9BACT|nr:putative Ig domain-containing protein [Larkinella insperata]